MEFLSTNDYKGIDVKGIGVGDEFVTHGSIKELNKLCQLDADGIYTQINQFLNKGVKDSAKTTLEHNISL